MSNGTFSMDMNAVHNAGGNVQNLADDFGTNKARLDNIVKGIVSSAFTSADAQAIARNIESYDGMLREIQAKLQGFGNYGTASSNTVSDMQDQIISRMN